MFEHKDLKRAEFHSLIRKGTIAFGGNKKLKIYGHLHCASGKRLLRENRVFFLSDKEAKNNNYRPCGHCMRQEYILWKQNNGSV
mgnify:CR=1 FL=1